MDKISPELRSKLDLIGAARERNGLDGILLRGVDWFSWITCGGSSAVLLGAEIGIADVLVGRAGAWVLTDAIEAARLEIEEVPRGLPVVAAPWAAGTSGRRALVEERVGRGRIGSDRPRVDEGELPLPRELREARWTLGREEIDRYRALGADAARAVGATLAEARPSWTGLELAGAAARALWSVGAHPMLALVAGEERLPLHRHPTPSAEHLGGRAMLVVCARRHGLYANLTRFVYFRSPTGEERDRHAAVAEVETAALAGSRPGAPIAAVLHMIVEAYAAAGHPGAEREHHQGGPCGYLARETVATPASTEVLPERGAVAWNPSLAGAKIEDTFFVGPDGAAVLTFDSAWPVRSVHGRARPDMLVRTDVR